MEKPSAILIDKFPFSPTEGQKRLFLLFDNFLENDSAVHQTLLLKGFAGTGKTSVVGAIVKTLPFFNKRYCLLAPTGRAAKVMSQYTNKVAFTIHKIIYKQVADNNSGFGFKRGKNYYKNTVFIVDEASMLSDRAEGNRGSLLDDLVSFVFEDNSNKLILIGDTAQLPPIGQIDSPALDGNYIKRHFNLSVNECLLTEVMRQEEQSGILYNATLLRELLLKESAAIKFKVDGYKDVFRMTGEKLEDGLRYAYGKHGVDNTIIICRSNKSAVQYNQYIRRAIHFFEEEIDAGDIIMVVKNNYHYLPENAPAGFLANGDFAEVMKIVNLEEIYGFRFATVYLRLVDYPDQEVFEAKIMLDTLHTATPSMTDVEYRKLYELVSEDYSDLENVKEKAEMIKKDPYLNALQVKFAYALTCHKSQGGQWNAVFIDQGYLKEEMIGQEYIKWLYTAITRSTDVVFLVNFSGNFF
ncbi:MAG: AAA family ATPase [Bacteroidota bacterium]|nr:AAA family ATPase [Bacteroidota bacterium]